ncbi:endolytic transglycosylase MltG [Methylobacter sp. Wu8]|uniref:endolytic transglycosylase MltG n=1 Tax=Methylobacter sp. Wu8 TaxID=3118457 RepID=UPI002F2DFDBA
MKKIEQFRKWLSKHLTRNNEIIGFAVLILSFAGGWIWMDYQSAVRQPLLFDRTVLIEIEKGDSLDRIIDKLEAEKLVLKPFWFKVIALQKNALRKLKTGEYELTPGLTAPKIIALFVQGKTKQHAITFPEGWSFKEIMHEIEKNADIEHTLSGVAFENVMSKLNLDAKFSAVAPPPEPEKNAANPPDAVAATAKDDVNTATQPGTSVAVTKDDVNAVNQSGTEVATANDGVNTSSQPGTDVTIAKDDMNAASQSGTGAAIAKDGVNAASQSGTGAAKQSPEGLFFPDTYFFEKHTPDVSLLKRAYDKMQSVLQQEWLNKAEGLPFKTPYEALILASIVEKETGAAAERPQIAGVFIRRLEQKMLLQTDPTVIYGMGDSYQGDIKSKDLTAATPYNTYVIGGLPPTPIAMPGRAALNAVLHPDQGDSLYFVGRGDGTHVFSATLKDHNSAVDKFQRKKK